ncbi:MAG: hypothetical protein GEU28_01735 [Dehalococcoidia bacterium]|nr:hypothetical protein [Dehalococcoidia bacterium]
MPDDWRSDKPWDADRDLGRGHGKDAEPTYGRTFRADRDLDLERGEEPGVPTEPPQQPRQRRGGSGSGGCTGFVGLLLPIIILSIALFSDTCEDLVADFDLDEIFDTVEDNDAQPGPADLDDRDGEPGPSFDRPIYLVTAERSVEALRAGVPTCFYEESSSQSCLELFETALDVLEGLEPPGNCLDLHTLYLDAFSAAAEGDAGLLMEIEPADGGARSSEARAALARCEGDG